ncbi:hypothetical protein [Actinomadura sp. DC4]|uniref:hypothetical protein n=1 Tax=Actinomadura sp. DC4 TaxID=3055069 RepID=UPI0025AFF18C|nr:hypothetical protein [Actinomadura sp. DC4]MDN3351807.1 hypothetical protein [Actinomadura sp. DC4]
MGDSSELCEGASIGAPRCGKLDKAFTPAQIKRPLARKPYDFRHAGVSLRLNAGTPPTNVAEWAGHSVEFLQRVYARCLDGHDGHDGSNESTPR